MSRLQKNITKTLNVYAYVHPMVVIIIVIIIILIIFLENTLTRLTYKNR